jgi:thiol:disulfide interchange protein DsbD
MPSQNALFCTLLIVAMTAAAAVPTAEAKPWWMRGADNNESDFLPPDVAFRVAASIVDGSNVRLRWVIADGYYLYKQKIEVKAESPDLVLGVPQLPQGVMKTDPYLGRQEIYTQQFEAQVPYSRNDFGAHPIQVKVTYQGCAEAGLCYPPITRVLFPVAGTPVAGTPVAGAPAAGSALLPGSAASAPHEWQLIAIIAGILGFLAAGFILRRGRRLPLPAQ